MARFHPHASMLHPSLSAKIQISDPGKKSDQCLLSSLMPLVFRAMDRNPSSYGHSDASEINAKMQAAFLLSYQHNGSVAPSTLTRPDGTRFQHFLQMIPNFLHHQWWNPSESFLERGIISYLYGMLGRVSATQLCWI